MTIFRRTFIVASAATALPLRAAFAQSGKIKRLGLLSPGAPDQGLLGPDIVRSFVALGYTDGKDITFEREAAKGQVGQLPGLLNDLVAKHVDVIITVGYPTAKIAKECAGSIPVVVTGSGDPVATGLVASLAHPGGDITGVSEIASELSAKRLALLKEAVPSVKSVAVLWNADDFGMTLRYQAAEVEAKRTGMLIVPLGVHQPDDFDTAFSEMTKTPPDAIMMVTDVLTILNRKRVIDYAAEHRLPAIFEFSQFAHQGGLLAYGPNQTDIYDRTAKLTDRILKGAKPADLPLELPTRFDLAVNLKTAKTLGLDIPQSILLQATEVIE